MAPSPNPLAPPDCPAARPDMAGARPFGIVSGTGGELRIAFFRKTTLAGFEWRGHFTDTEAAQSLRFGARCEERSCAHFSGGRCAMAEQVHVSMLPVVDQLPQCLIRGHCRWFAERGAGVCLRCPQVLGAAARAHAGQLLAPEAASRPAA